MKFGYLNIWVWISCMPCLPLTKIPYSWAKSGLYRKNVGVSLSVTKTLRVVARGVFCERKKAMEQTSPPTPGLLGPTLPRACSHGPNASALPPLSQDMACCGAWTGRVFLAVYHATRPWGARGWWHGTRPWAGQIINKVIRHISSIWCLILFPKHIHVSEAPLGLGLKSLSMRTATLLWARLNLNQGMENLEGQDFPDPDELLFGP